jgi:site-specific DNA recombinase
MRTAIYTRVSTMLQKHNTSLPEQERACREKAASLGWPVSEPHVYHEAESGEDLYRPCMDRLWDAIQAHEIDAVLVDVLDRLSRDEGDVGAFYHHCDRYGVQIELASEDLDETEHGRTLRTLSGMLARMERNDIKRRTMRGRRARAARGHLHPVSVPLYGYMWGDPEKGQRTYYVVDPETEWVVASIFTEVARGVPIRRLCKELEARGAPTPAEVCAARGLWVRKVTDPKTGAVTVEPRPYSHIWRPGLVLRILHTPSYWGAHRLNRWTSVAEKVRPAGGVTHKVRVIHERAEDDPACLVVGQRACPALVSAELAAQAHARLAVTKAESAGHNPDPLATLWRGLSYCGYCGGRLRTAQAKAGQRRYTCGCRDRVDPQTGGRARCPGGGFTMDAPISDPAGWRDVVVWQSEPENVARLFALWEEQQTQAERSLSSRLAAADATITELRARMGRIVDTISETADRESRHVLQEKLDAYAAQVHREEGKRAQLVQEGEEAAQRAQAQADMAALVAVVAEQAPTFGRAEQRATLRALGAELTLWREDYIHPDGWPKRYKVKLTFTGLTGEPVTLPANTASLLLASQTSNISLPVAGCG